MIILADITVNENIWVLLFIIIKWYDDKGIMEMWTYGSNQ